MPKAKIPLPWLIFYKPTEIFLQCWVKMEWKHTIVTHLNFCIKPSFNILQNKREFLHVGHIAHIGDKLQNTIPLTYSNFSFTFYGQFGWVSQTNIALNTFNKINKELIFSTHVIASSRIKIPHLLQIIFLFLCKKKCTFFFFNIGCLNKIRLFIVLLRFIVLAI